MTTDSPVWIIWTDPDPESLTGAVMAATAATGCGFRAFTSVAGIVQGLARIDGGELCVVVSDDVAPEALDWFVDRAKADFERVAFFGVENLEVDVLLHDRAFIRVSDYLPTFKAPALLWQCKPAWYRVEYRVRGVKGPKAQYIQSRSPQHAVQRLGTGELNRKAYAIKAPDVWTGRWVAWPGPDPHKIAAGHS